MKAPWGGVLAAILLIAAMVSGAQSVHYLDCSASGGAEDSLRPGSAWNSLARANAFTFQPGDSLLLKRGSMCRGMLAPRGSGAPSRPIAIGAYGTGALPLIAAGGNDAGLKLDNQQHWEIENLEIAGGEPYGILITGSAPDLSHFHIRNVVVHGVTGTPKSKTSGLIVVTPRENSRTLFHDILIDGATTYDTTQWAGIVIAAGSFDKKNGPIRGSDVTIRNSVVHDVAGDGILLMLAKNGVLEHNAAWNTGMQYTESIGTPDGIWEWMCEDCMVQYNEGFFTDSPGVDGGVFDIDFGNINNTVQYNFGHDSQGYCVSVFGAEGKPGFSRNSVVRGNVCLANGRSPREAQRQGAIYLSTWDGGRLNGVEVYGNTVYWDPPVETAAIVSDAEVDPAAPHLVQDNLIVSRVGPLVRSTGGLQFASNEYWLTTESEAEWDFAGHPHAPLSATQAAGQEKGTSVRDPKLDPLFHPAEAACTQPRLERDIYGRPMNACWGAVASAEHAVAERPSHLGALPFRSNGKPYAPHGWTLLALLSAEGQQESAASRSEMVVLSSMQKQFGSLGLHVAVAPNQPIASDVAVNWAADWNFGRIRRLDNPAATGAQKALGITGATGVVLIDPEGVVRGIWSGPPGAPALEMLLRHLIGTPVGMQEISVAPRAAVR